MNPTSSGRDGSGRWRPRWYELLPEFVLGIGLTVFLVDEPDAATSALASSRAVLLMAVTAALWIVGRVVVARLIPWRVVRTALFGLAALAVLAVVVLPAYRDETVVEAFPTTPSTDPNPETTARSLPATVPPSIVASTVPAPSAPSTSVPSSTSTPPTTTTTIPPAAEPVRLRSGPFTGIDHRASGTVSIFRAPGGTHVIGLEAFDIQPGPDYDVYVVPGTDRRDRAGGTRLDDLRGNQGTQYYEVPADVDVDAGDWTVLIWCQTFGVPVANATPV
jgi:hypothetical protein